MADILFTNVVAVDTLFFDNDVRFLSHFNNWSVYHSPYMGTVRLFAITRSWIVALTTIFDAASDGQEATNIPLLPQRLEQTPDGIHVCPDVEGDFLLSDAGMNVATPPKIQCRQAAVIQKR
uniref:Uncharacterized protein n=1 Tax=Romanomermis culicivorax TaxID=13658 RepID=A0A915JY14_ROMCU